MLAGFVSWRVIRSSRETDNDPCRPAISGQRLMDEVADRMVVPQAVTSKKRTKPLTSWSLNAWMLRELVRATKVITNSKPEHEGCTSFADSA